MFRDERICPSQASVRQFIKPKPEGELHRYRKTFQCSSWNGSEGIDRENISVPLSRPLRAGKWERNASHHIVQSFIRPQKYEKMQWPRGLKGSEIMEENDC